MLATISQSLAALAPSLFIGLRLLPLIGSLICFPVQADDSQPLYIEINQQEPVGQSQGYQYAVQWRIPARFTTANRPTLQLPDHCHSLSAQRGKPFIVATQARQRTIVRCDQTLAGETIEIVFAQFNPATSTLIKFHGLSGEQYTRLLKPSENTWSIPKAETASGIAWDYTVLGIQHILAGFDHLLFLLCLLLIAGSWRRVLLTITGFTVAHSLTLIVSALQWVRLPLPPVEAVIALSIIFLATEIVKDNRQTLTWRYPIAVSSSFGLLHGFGFAAALADIGLPQTDVITGLLFFNIGVELGQLFFAGGVLLALRYGQVIATAVLVNTKAPQVFRLCSSYAIGGLAAFWLFERLAAFVV